MGPYERFLVALLLLFTSTVTASSASHKPLSRTPKSLYHASSAFSLSKRTPSIFPRQVCTSGGTCAQCFGPGNVACPAGSYYTCYDSATGSLADCDSSFGTPSATVSSPGSITSTELCQNGGTCAVCFGAGYIDCPGSDFYCYDPSNATSTCPSGLGGTGTVRPTVAATPSAARTGSSSGGAGGTGSGNASCAQQYGAGNIECGLDGCYDPTAGETCCSDGNYCSAAAGTCSPVAGYCCDGSGRDTSPGCPGASAGGSGGVGGSSMSYMSSLLFPTTTSRSSVIQATPIARTTTQTSTNRVTQGTTQQPAVTGATAAATPFAGSAPASSKDIGGFWGLVGAWSLTTMVLGLAGLAFL